jgi:para-nitrobenzyl esterase
MRPLNPDRTASAPNLGPAPAPSQDCLWLSVYVPPGTTPSSRLPVMVWIHGGAFQFDDDSANGIGVGTGSGNYGLEDQHAALEWVKRNVQAFGGNAGNVTLLGQSAGATSICLQLISPGSAGLFQRAIIESGWYQEFFSADSSGLNFTPVIDGHFVPAQPQTAFARGHFTRVPVIVGVNRNEGLPTSVSTWSGLTQMAQANYGANAGRVLAAYPERDYASAADAAGAVVSDQMICSAVTTATRPGLA